MRKRRGEKPRKRNIPLMQWLGEATGKDARLTILGSRRALIENHLGVLDYTQTRLVLSTGRGALCVQGDNLALCDVRKGALIVSGIIRKVELPDA